MIGSFSGDFAFLSNFARLDVALPDPEFPELRYPSVEHAFQSAKTVSLTERRVVAACLSPGQAKRAGRKVTLRPGWEQIRDGVMLRLLRAKFAQPRLQALLLATGQLELVERNSWHDRHWGVCICSACGNTGGNRLGQLLMVVRSELQAGEQRV